MATQKVTLELMRGSLEPHFRKDMEQNFEEWVEQVTGGTLYIRGVSGIHRRGEEGDGGRCG